jgi:beta-galactosidase
MMQLLRLLLFLTLFSAVSASVWAQPAFTPGKMDEILYGVAYYYEYLPTDRLSEDAAMMKDCGINVVRIGESTWAYQEPQDGVFKTDYLTRILDTLHAYGLKVIIGTPTYAIPSWLAKKHPDILLTNKNGQRPYGARQIMDISNPAFRFHAERIIRRQMETTARHPAVIGFQVDNETKHYGAEGANVQAQFVAYLKAKFGEPEAMNKAFGLHYWSNSVFDWADMPSTIGTINGSLRNEFEKFRRLLVTEYLAWQVDIVNEYKQPHQFVTQNFDMDWRSGSYAIQASVDHFEAARAMDIAGIDIYHGTGDRLDGVMIAFGGDLARSMKQDNYLVVETSAQSILGPSNQELLYPGQLRTQAYSHLANGANAVMYWHWHSIHNSAETYWKGLLSHDMEPNPTYLEAKEVAAELEELSPALVNLKKDNEVAIYFSNEALTSLKEFAFSKQMDYNDIVRNWYETLYKMNVEADFADHTVDDLSRYKLLLVPPLYTASDAELEKLNAYVENGGHILYGFKSGFTDEHVQVHMERQPAMLRETLGFSYQQFTGIDRLPLKDDPFGVGESDNYVSIWAELLTPEGAEVLGRYDHPHWGRYACITQNRYGKGQATYIGAWPSPAIMQKLIADAVGEAGVERPNTHFPVIIRKGVNGQGAVLHYVFNYSPEPQTTAGPVMRSTDLLTGKKYNGQTVLPLEPWGVAILRED